jgi:hypothetical protein
MRAFIPKAFVPTLALLTAFVCTPAFAQVPVPAAPPDAPAQAAPPDAAPAPARPRAQRPRGTFAQRFNAANTTHDGKLTLEQARAARFRSVVRNFTAMDRDGKGYVTRHDVVAYRKALRAQRAAPAQVQPQ